MTPQTQAAIDRVVAASNSTRFRETDLRELMLSELRDQDRRTRQECSEAVDRLVGYDSWCILFKEDARQAINNTSAL